jgi:DNA-binding MarR family transcriptional regulator
LNNREPASKDLQLAEDLRRVVGDFVRMVRAQADTPSDAQSETLGLLGRHGPLSIAKLGQHRRVKHQSMRLVIGHLETSGLICRKADPADGRKQLIDLTEQGRTALESARKSRADWIADALQQHFSEEDRRALRETLRALERMIDANKI